MNSRKEIAAMYVLESSCIFLLTYKGTNCGSWDLYRDLQVVSALMFFGYKTTLCGVLLFLVDYLVRDRSRSPEAFL